MNETCEIFIDEVARVIVIEEGLHIPGNRLARLLDQLSEDAELPNHVASLEELIDIDDGIVSDKDYPFFLDWHGGFINATLLSILQATMGDAEYVLIPANPDEELPVGLRVSDGAVVFTKVKYALGKTISSDLPG